MVYAFIQTDATWVRNMKLQPFPKVNRLQIISGIAALVVSRTLNNVLYFDIVLDELITPMVNSICKYINRTLP